MCRRGSRIWRAEAIGSIYRALGWGLRFGADVRGGFDFAHDCLHLAGIVHGVECALEDGGSERVFERAMAALLLHPCLADGDGSAAGGIIDLDESGAGVFDDAGAGGVVGDEAPGDGGVGVDGQLGLDASHWGPEDADVDELAWGGVLNEDDVRIARLIAIDVGAGEFLAEFVLLIDAGELEVALVGGASRDKQWAKREKETESRKGSGGVQQATPS
jgi:hypothetical protein